MASTVLIVEDDPELLELVDLHVEDKHLMKDIINEFLNTRFGKFKTSVKTGKDFGNLEELVI